MKIKILADIHAVAEQAAAIIAAEAWAAVGDRSRFTVAFSGGSTPQRMLTVLAGTDMPWNSVHVAQVDERVAPAGDPVRNLTQLRQCLIEHTPLPRTHLYPMPVESPDLRTAAVQYALTLQVIAGAPAILDLIHLGLGTDGHTASLFPGDSVLHIANRDVAVTGRHHGTQRMTLTYPILNRARRILWLVTGSDKAEMLARLCAGDASIPAGMVRRDHALVIADREAAAQLKLATGTISVSFEENSF